MPPARKALVEKDPAIGRMTFRPVTAARWSDLEDLFESRGGPKYCWCMAWRQASQRHRLSSTQRKAALERYVTDGVPIGILAYVKGTPVAWCSIAPRPTYRPLGGADETGEPPHKVWSLVCFFVKRELRGGGAMKALIEAAVAYAKRKGAAAIEAYPVKQTSPSYRFMGFVSSFEAAGFEHVGRAGSRRHVMRKAL